MRFRLAVLTSLVFAFAIAPAVADRSATYDFFAGTARTKGDVHVSGTLTWSNHGRRVQVRGLIDDQCPADGYGSRVVFSIITPGPVEGQVLDYKDNTKCKNLGTPYDMGMKSSKGEQIIAVKIWVFEYDNDGKQSDEPDDWRGDEQTRVIFNPGPAD